MATRFRAAEKRGFWIGLLVWSTLDSVVVFIIVSFWTSGAETFAVAAFAVVCLWMLQAALALYGFCQHLISYWLFDKERRVGAMLDQLITLQMPAPGPAYEDADEYLLAAASDPRNSKEGHLLSGVLLGVLQSTRQFGPRAVALTTTLVLEESLRRYRRTIGMKHPRDDWMLSLTISTLTPRKREGYQMADNSGYWAALFIIIWLVILAPNSEQHAVTAMAGCHSINAEPQALYRCMNYQGFEVAEPGQAVTEVTNYVIMYGWEHGAIKRGIDTVTGWFDKA